MADESKPQTEGEATAARLARQIARDMALGLDAFSCEVATKILQPYVVANLEEREILRSLLERIHDQASGPDGLRYMDPLMAEIERTIGTWKRLGNAAP